MNRAAIAPAILVSWLLLALIADLFAFRPDSINLENILQPPSATEWMGYDELGRPILDRVIAGAKTSFQIAFSVITLSAITGILIGTLAGYAGGRVDSILAFITDIFLAFPGILLAIALAGVLGPGINNVVIALAVVGWVGYARLARVQVLSLKQREHIVAAHALGSRTPRIMIRHLLPLMGAPLIIEATFGVASVVIAEAGLSFLGLGVQPPEASWGSMIREGVRYLLVAPHLVMVPGSFLFIVVFAVNILGDALRDRLDIRQNRSQHAGEKTA